MAARLSSGPEILGLKIGAQSARPLEFYIRNSAWITGWNSVPYSFQLRFSSGDETLPGDCLEARRIRSNYVVPTLVSHFYTVSRGSWILMSRKLGAGAFASCSGERRILALYAGIGTGAHRS